MLTSFGSESSGGCAIPSTSKMIVPVGTPTLDETFVHVSPLGSDFSLERFPLFDAVTPFANPQAIAAGDFNDDGVVNMDDFLIMASNFNLRAQTFADGDMDFNRRIDLADFIEFRQLFNAQQVGQAQNVPEPSAAFLVACGAVLLVRLRRKFDGR